jgi:biotin transport system permease protein
MMREAQEILEAQRARGLDRNAIAVLVPLLIKTLKMADDLSDAIDARGYDAETVVPIWRRVR